MSGTTVTLMLMLILSMGANVALGLLLLRAATKLLQFDDLANYLVDDVETNISYFDKLTSTPVLQNSPEIMDAQKNMVVMSARLDEFLTRFEELTGTKLRKQTTPKPIVEVG